MSVNVFTYVRTQAMGFTLLEVLVTLVLLSIGLLGLAGLQVASLKNNHVSYYRSVASQQAYDIADRMRANQCGVNAGSYDNLTAVMPADPGCFPNNCTSAQMAVVDQMQWLQENTVLLPGGTGTVRCCTQGTVAAGNCACNPVLAVSQCLPGQSSVATNRVFEISVSWTEKNEVGSVSQTFVTRFAP